MKVRIESLGFMVAGVLSLSAGGVFIANGAGAMSVMFFGIGTMWFCFAIAFWNRKPPSGEDKSTRSGG